MSPIRSSAGFWHERGAIVKDWGGRLPVALIYPNTYQVGMSSLGLQTVYRLFNAHADVVCERVFWQAEPDRRPPCSVETRRPLADFAVLTASLSFELDYAHLLQLLRQADIPLMPAERADGWPPVIVGGPAVSANPLPLADFVDAVVVGEAEPILDQLVDVLCQGVWGDRSNLWAALAGIPGVYVPPLHSDDMSPVKRQWVRDLENWPTHTVIYTPDTEFGDMSLIEVSRGCGRGCRFCMAGFITRPKREHSLASILAQAQASLGQSRRIGLVGAAVSDHSQIDLLATRLREMRAAISVSSLRVDPLSEPLLRALAESGSRTLTMAPEAGSERLRQFINKGVGEAELVHAAQRAASWRFHSLKLYFMIGLPGETDEDVAAIGELCRLVAGYFPGRLIANVTPFVPKAQTPFQREAMASIETLQTRSNQLGRLLRPLHIEVKGESPRWAAVQGVLARGDRRWGAVLAALDGPSFRSWQRAAQTQGLDLQAEAVRAFGDPLPWGFVHCGVSPAEMQREQERAHRGQFTPPCPPDGCVRCGVCAG